MMCPEIYEALDRSCPHMIEKQKTKQTLHMIEKVSHVLSLTHLLPFQKQCPWPYFSHFGPQENIVARKVMMYDVIRVEV